MATPPTFDLAGSVAKTLFLGNVLEQNLTPFPAISGAEAETLSMVLESIDRFMESYEERYREFDREGAQPDDYLDELRELGLFGLIIPEEYGGMGFSNASYSRVLQQTSRFDGSTSLTIGAHSSIGMKGLLLFGSDEQKQRYLPQLATGELVAAFCLTEPGSGSDAASIKTSGTKQPDGSWLLTGEKIWITNGAFAGFFTVFARTEGAGGKLTAFIVERSFSGVSTGPKEDKMGIRASATTTVSFQNVRIPPENVLGGEGNGFKVAMSILNNGRTGLGGGCVGAMKRSISRAVRHATERKQFGRSISEFLLVKDKIARMTVAAFAAESVVQMVASYIDRGAEDYSVEAAISKVYASEALWFTANEALQVAGGTGFMREYPYERVVRDARINMIFEGTNEILRLYIGLSGFKPAGEMLKEVGKSAATAFNDPIKGFGVLSGFAARKFTQLTSFGRDRIAFTPPELKAEAEIFERYTLEFGRAVERLLRRYGGGIVGRQLATRRIADTAIDLFVGLCVLSRVSTMIASSSAERCVHEIELAKLFSHAAKRRMSQNLRRLARNEDAEVEGLADYILAEGRFPWDIIAR